MDPPTRSSSSTDPRPCLPPTPATPAPPARPATCSCSSTPTSRCTPTPSAGSAPRSRRTRSSPRCLRLLRRLAPAPRRRSRRSATCCTTTCTRRARGPAETFWTGLGAVRRADFLAVGGFDGDRYPHPSIEDIELGHRLTAAGGRLRLDPTIQGTHLKRWTLRSMLWTDFARRGAPWVALQLPHAPVASTLNCGWRHRVSALVCALVPLAVLAGAVRPALALGGALVALNHAFYALLLRQLGVGAWAGRGRAARAAPPRRRRGRPRRASPWPAPLVCGSRAGPATTSSRRSRPGSSRDARPAAARARRLRSPRRARLPPGARAACPISALVAVADPDRGPPCPGRRPPPAHRRRRAVASADDAASLLDVGPRRRCSSRHRPRPHTADAAVAAAAGVHALLEKPPAPSAGERRSPSLQLDPAPWVGFNRRFDPGARRVRRGRSGRRDRRPATSRSALPASELGRPHGPRRRAPRPRPPPRRLGPLAQRAQRRSTCSCAVLTRRSSPSPPPARGRPRDDRRRHRPPPRRAHRRSATSGAARSPRTAPAGCWPPSGRESCVTAPPIGW